VSAELEGGEYIMNKRAVAKYGVGAMAAINSGRSSPANARSSGGATTIINTIDPGLLDKYLASSAGKRAIVNVVRAQRFEVSKVLGR
jgi:hypothetical protein